MKKDNKFENEIAGDLATVSGVPVAEASKPKSKSSKASASLRLVAAPVVTSPEANAIEWTLPTADELGALTPEDLTDDRIVVITVLQWGGINPATTLWEAAGGLEIKQFSRVPAITKFVNEVTAAGKIGVGMIPVGATEVRVAHLTALKAGDSYKADTIDTGDAIAWSTPLAVTFTEVV